MNHNKTSKLFSALVLGGAVMAGASDQELFDVGNKDEMEPICQVSMVQKDYKSESWKKGKGPEVVQTLCLDGKTDDEVLEIVNDAKEKSCFTPFCGCWLG